MKKVIIKEISRINELMGTKKLIVEQAWLINFIKQVSLGGDNYIASAAKSIDNFVSSKAKTIYDSGKITKQQYDNLVAALKNKGEDAIKYVKSGGDDVDEYIKRISSNASVQKTFRKVVVGLTDAEMSIMRRKAVDEWDGFDYWYNIMKEKGFKNLENPLNKSVTKDDFINKFGLTDRQGIFKEWPEAIEKMQERLKTDSEVTTLFEKRFPTESPTTSVSKVAGSAKGSKFYGKMELPDGTIKDIPSNTYYSKETIDDIDYMIHKNIDGSEIPEGKIKLTKNVADEAPGYKFYDSMKLPDGTVVRIPEGTYYVRETIDNVDYLIQRNVDGDEILAGRRRMDNPNITTPRDVGYTPPEVELMSPFARRYWIIIEPWWRKWVKNITIIFFKRNKIPMNVLMSDFETAFFQGVRAAKTSGFEGIDSAYIRKTIQKFNDLGYGYQGNLDQASDIYQKLWEDFITKAESYFATRGPEEIKQFNDFRQELLTFRSKSRRNPTMSEIFGSKEGSVVDNAVKDEVNFFSKQMQKYAPDLIDKFNGNLKQSKYLPNIYSLLSSASWQTPADFSLQIMRNNSVRQRYFTNPRDLAGSLPQKLAQQKGSAAWSFFRTFLLSYILIPGFLGTVEFFTDGATAIDEKIKAKGEGSWYNRLFFYYIVDAIKKQKSFMSTLLDAVPFLKKKDKNGDSWWVEIGKYIPGLQNDVLLKVGDRLYTLATGTEGGKYGSEEEKEKADDAERRKEMEKLDAEKLELQKKMGFYPREIPEQVGKLSEEAGFFKNYLAMEGSRAKVPKDKDIPNNKIAFVLTNNLVRSDGNNVWIEDFSYDKKYFVKYLKQYANDNKKPLFIWSDGNSEKSIYDLVNIVARSVEVTEQEKKDLDNMFKKKKSSLKNKIKSKSKGEPTTVGENNIYNYNLKRSIMENNGKKFGEDNFKHWKKTFTFYNFDNESGEYKEVKITSKMDEIMDTIDHYRKKYDEDDSFVRAVVDVFGDKIDRVSFNKDMARLTESVRVFGLMKVLANIRESKELEIWTVKHYSDGNWELVKGSFNKKELQNVGKTVKNREKEQEERKKPVDGLKKKEEEVISALKSNEDSIMNNLPIKVKEKVREKLSKGWTTETPFSFFEDFFTKSEINSAFSGKIEIFKLKPSKEFLNSLAINSSRINVKKGFCKSLKNIEGEIEMNDRQKNIVQHFIKRCENKFQNQIKKYKPKFND